MAKAQGNDLAFSMRIGAVARRAAALAQRGAVAAGLPAGFDAGAYLALNPDVAAQGIDAAKHYLRFGRAELRRLLPDGGRLDHPESRALSLPERANWRAALGHRARHHQGGLAGVIRDHPRIGWAYAGFTLAAYLLAAPDLAAQIDDPIEAVFHYLEIGLETGGYIHPARAEPAVLMALYGLGAGGAMESLARLLAAGHSSFDITLTEAELWARHGLAPALSRHFDPVHYHAMAGRLAPLGAPAPPVPDCGPNDDPALSRIRLLAHFLTVGQHWRGPMAQVMPIHPDLGFDAKFYAPNGDYRHFLRRGVAGKVAGDAAGALSAACGLPVGQGAAGAIVAALPAYAKAAGLPALPVAGQLSALTKDADPAGFAALVAALHGPFAADARAALGRLALRPHHPPDRARRLMWALAAAGGDDPWLLSGLAARAADQARQEEAVALRARAFAARGHDVARDPWLALSVAEDAIATGQLDKAAETLTALWPVAQGDVALSQRRTACARRVFDAIWGNLQAEVAQHRVAGVRARLALALGALTPPRCATPMRHKPIRKIALVGSEDIPQSHRYRVLQKADHLRRAGFILRRYDVAELAGAFTEALPDIDAAIFCRLPAFPDVIAAIGAARDHGVLSIYDIDDALFDSENFPPNILSYMGKIDQNAHDLMACGTVLFEHCVRLCDHAFAPVAPLVTALQKLLPDGKARLYPNALDPVLMAATTRPPRPRGDAVTLFYGSATLAHKSDFHDLLEPALARVLARYGNRVRLHLVGAFGAMTALDPRDPRVTIEAPFTDYQIYLARLAQADINLSVLTSSALADTKSPIKWVEAAAHAIPSVVTRTQPNEAAITDGKTGLIVDDAAGFVAAISRLIDDPELAARMGLAARARVVETLSPDAMAAQARQLVAALSPPPSAARKRRKKLLVVNVFYPPQAIGGATRVVADTTRAFQNAQGADWEVEVVCTLSGGATPLSVTRWADHGIRVHAITAPPQTQGDMAESDPRMGAVFERLLDDINPDLVHFHCIQRLTASVVETARARGLPFVVTLHDGWWLSDHQFLFGPLGGAEVYDYRTNPPGRAGRLAPLLRAAARVVAVSAPFADLHRRAGLPMVGVLENAAPRFTPHPRIAGDLGRVRLGHLGGTSPIKGLPLLQSALMAGDFPNLDLTVVDPARAHGPPVNLVWGSTQVRLVPPVAQDRVGALYAGLDVLVAPSIWPESYGLVAREARLAGLWVIASDRGAMGADLRDGVDGFVVDVAHTAPLMAVLGRINADPARFAAPPPPARAMRSLADQVAEMAVLYTAILAGPR